MTGRIDEGAAATDRGTGGSEAILVLAPLGRDAELACATLAGAGLACRSGRALSDLDLDQLGRLDALVLAEEMLSGAAIGALTRCLDAQAPWSSLPVVILADPDRRRSNEAHESAVEALGARTGVILLERPTSVASFVSVLRSAVLTRRRQYELRDQLEARRKAEAHAWMLADEMKHRVKNSLTLAIGIASQTFRDVETPDRALAAFSARLMAMSRAQDLLTAQGRDSADLGELVDQALGPYRSGADWHPFEVDGAEVRIGARMATAFSMALHELATNAVKYGALSVPSGRVAIRWRLEGDASHPPHLQFEWRERGGPPVTMPQRRGFGSRLIERALMHDLGSTAKIDFDPDGIICTICAVMARPHEAAAP